MNGITRICVIIFISLMAVAASATQPRPDEPTDGQSMQPHVRVDYHQTPATYADAMAQLSESIWGFYTHDYSLDMPKQLILSIDIQRANRPAIFNDGDKKITLTLRTVWQLQNPSKSKMHIIYGLCHEMAELALRRTLGNPVWLKDSAKGGWAYYAATAAIDRLYSLHNQSLWPDRYNYLNEGTVDLKNRLKKRRVSEVVQIAGLWKQLVSIVDTQAVGQTMRAWRKAQVDVKRPATALRPGLPAPRDSYRQSKLNHWFKAFIKRAVESGTLRHDRSKAIRSLQLNHKPVLLKYDNNKSNGKACLQTQGHIIYFSSPPDQWYITKLHLYGERFGVPLRKMEYATITLCDRALKPVTSWKKPYGFFRGSHPRWYHLPLSPVEVPAEFALVVQFFCRDDKGVRLHREDSSRGHSAIGIPGGTAEPLDSGDWMIRVELDTDKRANSLLGPP